MSKKLQRSNSARNLYASRINDTNAFFNTVNNNNLFFKNPTASNNNIFYNTFESLPTEFKSTLHKINYPERNLHESVNQAKKYVSKFNFKTFNASSFIKRCYDVIAMYKKNVASINNLYTKKLLLDSIKSIFIIIYKLGRTLSISTYTYPKTVLIGSGLIVSILYPYYVALTVIWMITAKSFTASVPIHNVPTNDDNTNERNNVINDVVGILSQIPKSLLDRIDKRVIKTAMADMNANTGSNGAPYRRQKQYRNLGNNSETLGLKRNQIFISQRNAIRAASAKSIHRPITRSMTIR